MCPGAATLPSRQSAPSQTTAPGLYSRRKRPRASTSARPIPCAHERGRLQARPRNSAPAPAALSLPGRR
ncbi:hypothetical protein NDU88_002722 [Pleurodeles waltl]|uniref:Uncharacterized protein n=1 Tax=Pleurodeles waltl TaxID=8319 RepID=A0AAV7Q7Y6_PLEWA|nr:hypothetical protein NDU88_002722 [Pleurodeles waltl]